MQFSLVFRELRALFSRSQWCALTIILTIFYYIVCLCPCSIPNVTFQNMNFFREDTTSWESPLHLTHWLMVDSIKFCWEENAQINKDKSLLYKSPPDCSVRFSVWKCCDVVETGQKHPHQRDWGSASQCRAIRWNDGTIVIAQSAGVLLLPPHPLLYSSCPFFYPLPVFQLLPVKDTTPSLSKTQLYLVSSYWQLMIHKAHVRFTMRCFQTTYYLIVRKLSLQTYRSVRLASLFAHAFDKLPSVTCYVWGIALGTEDIW